MKPGVIYVVRVCVGRRQVKLFRDRREEAAKLRRSAKARLRGQHRISFALWNIPDLQLFGLCSLRKVTPPDEDRLHSWPWYTMSLA